MHKTRRRSAAFTLVELLVTFAVICILAIVTISTTSKVIEAGRTMKCTGNLHQLQLAMNHYIRDHSGRFPLAYNDPDYLGMVPNWGPTWAEYLVASQLQGNKAPLHCPSRPSNWANAAGYYPDYGYNIQLADKRALKIESPSKIVLFADSAHPNWQNPVAGIYGISEATNVHFRHSGKTAQVVYVDGHMAAVRQSSAIPVAADTPLGFNAFYPYFD